MSRESDEALLLEFGAWWNRLHMERLRVLPGDVDRFLDSREPQATEQRYWKIHEQDVGFGVNSNYQAMECDRFGVRLCDIGPMHFGRANRAAAEADGRASGLPEWQPDAIPAALPTDVTVPGRTK